MSRRAVKGHEGAHFVDPQGEYRGAQHGGFLMSRRAAMGHVGAHLRGPKASTAVRSTEVA
jgi:hypothetical protein